MSFYDALSIIHDLDGSFTGNGKESFIAVYASVPIDVSVEMTSACVVQTDINIVSA